MSSGISYLNRRHAGWPGRSISSNTFAKTGLFDRHEIVTFRGTGIARGSGVIQTVLKIKVSPNRMNDLVQALKSLTVSARAEHGLIGCTLYQEVGDETALRFIEDWQTEDDLENQIRSNRYTQLLALMETAAELPSLEFRTVAQTRGLDYLQAVRSGAKT